MKDFLDNANLTKSHAKISIYIWIWLLVLSILIMILWILLLNIELTGDNLVYMISWLFISWLSLILFPMYFQNNIEKVEIQNWINSKLDEDDEKILYEIKELLEKENIENDLFDINKFQIENNDVSRYLIKNKGAYVRSKRFIVWYNIPNKIFYLLKKNIKWPVTSEFKKNFIDYEKEKNPYFKFSKDTLSTENKIKEIIKVLNKL